MAAGYHIVIVGGGMGGASLALLLAGATPHRITLVEQVDLVAAPLPQGSSYDARSSALALGTAEVLAGIGVWPHLAPQAAPIRDIQVSHQGRFGAARLSAREEGVAALGYVAENRWIGCALVTALKASRVALRAPRRVDALRRDGDRLHLQLDDGDALDADLLVVADGAGSLTREALGISVQEHDYGADAIVCNVTPRAAHGGTAYERFTRDGALALLPLTENRVAVVWSLPRARAQAVRALGDAAFLTALDEAAGGRLDGFVKAGERHAYPLERRVATEQVQPGVVLVGNAAHLLHPVAGQGFNLTLRDAAALARLLGAAPAGTSPGGLALLQQYAQSRMTDQQLTTGLSHGLPLLFTQRNPLLAAGRDLGLLAFDLFAPLKREFARQAMGIGVFTGGTGRAR